MGENIASVSSIAAETLGSQPCSANRTYFLIACRKIQLQFNCMKLHGNFYQALSSNEKFPVNSKNEKLQMTSTLHSA